MANLPENLRGFAPLLGQSRLFGLLPYELTDSLRVQRSTAWAMYSITVTSLLPAFIIYLSFNSSRVAATWEFRHTVSYIQLFSLTGIFSFTVYNVGSICANNSSTFQKLLHHLTDLEKLLGVCRILILKRILVLVFLCAILISDIAMAVLDWSEDTFICTLVGIIFETFFHAMLGILCYLFLAFALIVKHYFSCINKKIWLLSVLLRKEEHQPLQTQAKNVNTFCKNYLLGTISESSETAFPCSDYMTVDELRDVHYIVQETSRLVDKIFRGFLLLLYSQMVVNVVGCLHTLAVARAQAQLSHAIITPLYHFVAYFAMGLALAVVGGSAAAEGGGEPAARAVTTLLLSARGRSDAQKQARLLLLQMRCRSVGFSVGGLFALDLRFYVGMLGTIVGYVVVAVQFSQSNECGEK